MEQGLAQAPEQALEQEPETAMVTVTETEMAMVTATAMVTEAEEVVFRQAVVTSRLSGESYSSTLT